MARNRTPLRTTSRMAPPAPDPFAIGSSRNPPPIDYQQEIDWDAFDASLSALKGLAGGVQEDVGASRARLTAPTTPAEQQFLDRAAERDAWDSSATRFYGGKAAPALARIATPIVGSFAGLPGTALGAAGGEGIAQALETVFRGSDDPLITAREQLGGLLGSQVGNLPFAGGPIGGSLARRAILGAGKGAVEGVAGNVGESVTRSVVGGHGLPEQDQLEMDALVGLAFGVPAGAAAGAIFDDATPSTQTWAERYPNGRQAPVRPVAPDESMVPRTGPIDGPPTADSTGGLVGRRPNQRPAGYQPADELDEMVLDVPSRDIQPPAQLQAGTGTPQLPPGPMQPQLPAAGSIQTPPPAGYQPPAPRPGVFGPGRMQPSSHDVLSPEYLARVEGTPRPPEPAWTPEAELNRMVLDDLTANELDVRQTGTTLTEAAPGGGVIDLAKPVSFGGVPIARVDASDPSRPILMPAGRGEAIPVPRAIAEALGVELPPVGPAPREVGTFAIDRVPRGGESIVGADGRRIPVAGDPPNPMADMPRPPAEPYEFRPGQIDELERMFNPPPPEPGRVVATIDQRAQQVRRQPPPQTPDDVQLPPDDAPPLTPAERVERIGADPVDELLETESFRKGVAEMETADRARRQRKPFVRKSVDVGEASDIAGGKVYRTKLGDKDAVEVAFNDRDATTPEQKAALREAGFRYQTGSKRWHYNVPTDPRVLEQVRFKNVDEAEAFARQVMTPKAPEEPAVDIEALLRQADEQDAAVAPVRDEPTVEVLDEGDIQNNASGDSSASVEAMNRDRAMKAKGQQFVMLDRAGRETPLIGTDAVDQVPGPGQTKAIRNADGSYEVVQANGGKVPPKVYREEYVRSGDTPRAAAEPEVPQPKGSMAEGRRTRALEGSVSQGGKAVKRGDLVREYLDGGGGVRRGPDGERRLHRDANDPYSPYVSEKQIGKTAMDAAEEGGAPSSAAADGPVEYKGWTIRQFTDPKGNRRMFIEQGEGRNVTNVRSLKEAQEAIDMRAAYDAPPVDPVDELMAGPQPKKDEYGIEIPSMPRPDDFSISPWKDGADYKAWRDYDFVHGNTRKHRTEPLGDDPFGIRAMEAKEEAERQARNAKRRPKEQSTDEPDADGFTRNELGWRAAPEGTEVEGWKVGDTAGDGRTVKRIFEVPAKGKKPATWRAEMSDGKEAQNVDLSKLKARKETPNNPPRGSESDAAPNAPEKSSLATQSQAPEASGKKPRTKTRRKVSAEDVREQAEIARTDPDTAIEDAVAEMKPPDDSGFVMGSGFGGLQQVGQLFRKDPNAAYLTMRTGIGALMGGLYGEYFDDQPYDSSLDEMLMGAAAGAGLSPAWRKLKSAAPAAYDALVQMRANGQMSSLPGGPKLTARPPRKAGDISAIDQMLWTPDKVVPETWGHIRPILDTMNEELDRLAKTHPPGFVDEIRKTYVLDALNTLRQSAKDAKAAGHKNQAAYLERLEHVMSNKPEWFEQVGMKLAEAARLPEGQRRRVTNQIIQGSTQLFYNQVLGLALDSAAGNLTQSAITGVMIGPGDSLRGMLEAFTKAGKQKAGFLTLDRPMGAEDMKDFSKTLDALNNVLQTPMRWTDSKLRMGAFLGSMRHAERRGASKEEARKFALDIVGMTQGVPGDVGGNPYHKALGPVRALSRYPLLWASFVQDVAQHPDPAVKMRALGLLTGATALSAIGGYNLMNYVVPRVPGVPYAEAAIDAAKHATGNLDLDHRFTEHLSLFGDRSAVMPRYITDQLIPYAKRLATHGTGERTVLDRRGNTIRKEGFGEDSLRLLGMRSNASESEREQTSEMYEFAQGARQDMNIRSRQAKRAAAEALEAGDHAAADKALRELTPLQRRRFLRERNTSPQDRMRRMVPTEKRDEFDRLFDDQE